MIISSSGVKIFPGSAREIFLNCITRRKLDPGSCCR